MGIKIRNKKNKNPYDVVDKGDMFDKWSFIAILTIHWEKDFTLDNVKIKR